LASSFSIAPAMCRPTPDLSHLLWDVRNLDLVFGVNCFFLP
jgi:hypothetical protein